MKRLFQVWEIGSNDMAHNSPARSKAQRLVGVLQVEPADHRRGDSGGLDLAIGQGCNKIVLECERRCRWL